MRRTILIPCLFLFSFWYDLFSQDTQPSAFVNPFIGTSTSDVYTKWGNEGGTYPGAVAPWGFVQLTPETSVSEPFGYRYNDSSIYFFSCINHFSGYPSGSSGKIMIMPVDNARKFKVKEYSRPFLHSNEKATPGFYSVFFSDNNTLVEATSTERCGMFRITFPPKVSPRIFVGGFGSLSFINNNTLHGTDYYAVFSLSENFSGKKKVDGGYMLSFKASSDQPKPIIIKLSVSSVSSASSKENIDVELKDLGFDQVHELAKQRWNKALSAVEIDDSNEKNKTIYYTALYHSFLMPWIISDVDGNYLGKDGKVHKTRGKKQYGGFSSWDTFRSLHPLLSLLNPDVQQDIMLSMLDVYQQTGRLPADPMTGNHAVAVLVDSYLKGIKVDSTNLFDAMRYTINTPHYSQKDMSVYQELGYVPSVYPESVTRTVEYAYDDWALSQFAEEVMRNEGIYRASLERSYNYRNLFDPRDLFLLPRNSAGFNRNPGTVGYKEGDKWSYSFFVPHNVTDLVNLMGGNVSFSSLLDSALTNQFILFDNETNFHIPYLFNYANVPYKTQKWVRNIMENRFKDTPGGIPGNDDLGSMSSWYVFSAMGFYPVCPGRPLYDLGSPVFKKLVIHLPNGKDFCIKNTNPGKTNIYVKMVKDKDGNELKQLQIPHSMLVKGGELNFETVDYPVSNTPTSNAETALPSKIEVVSYKPEKNEVFPDELFWIRFQLANNGSLGTKKVKVYVNGKEYGSKNCLVEDRSNSSDSISCRLYPVSMVNIQVDSLPETVIQVKKHDGTQHSQFEITNFRVNHMVRKGDYYRYSYNIQNIGGFRDSASFQICLDNVLKREEKIILSPGELANLADSFRVSKAGMQVIRLDSVKRDIKVFETENEACVLDISTFSEQGNPFLPDNSGLHNSGKIINVLNDATERGLVRFDKDHYVEVIDSGGLESLKQELTMMAWVLPSEENKGLVDIFTRGDFNVIQMDGENLSFFAGGWGRGSCTVRLPRNWFNRWHHIAGVCAGTSLKLYIDGNLMGEAKVVLVNLLFSGKWLIGRNEEFPSERIYHGYIDKVKIYTSALPNFEIDKIFKAEKSIIHSNH